MSRLFIMGLIVHLTLVFAGTAVAQSTPYVSKIDAELVPSLQGMKAMSFPGEKSCPIFAFDGHGYLTYSFIAKPGRFAIVLFDQQEKPARSWVRDGIRELKTINVDSKEQRVEFVGKNGKNVAIAWDDLRLPHATRSVSNTSPGATGRSSNKASSKFERSTQLFKEGQAEMSADSQLLDNDLKRTRHEIVKKLSSSNPLSPQDAQFLMIEIVTLDIGAVGVGISQMFGTESDSSGSNIAKTFEENTKLLRVLGKAVNSNRFTGTKSERREILKKISEMIRAKEERPKTASDTNR